MTAFIDAPNRTVRAPSASDDDTGGDSDGAGGRPLKPLTSRRRSYPGLTRSPGLHALRALALIALALPLCAIAGDPGYAPREVSVPLEFLLFAAILIGVAAFHRFTLQIALTGLTVILAFKFFITGFDEGPGWLGLIAHLEHEWVLLANLLGLLLGFALLARHFEDSRVPELLPRFLPDNWTSGLVLLAMIFVLSGFLDNIAAALIGGTVAGTVFRHRLHIGYLVAIVAASNAGGAGSVLGDTTTTMMWISGVSPLDVLHAYLAAGVALLVFGIPAALQQHAYSPVIRHASHDITIDWMRLRIVAIILGAALATNLFINLMFKEVAEAFPFLGLAVWMAIAATARLRAPEWSLLPENLRGSLFLLSLVLCASLMPVDKLPPASWPSALGLGFVSSVFDNIPLTALAIAQDGYDWGVLAFAVGFGGSMVWFGSSAGVAVSNLYPQAKSVLEWVKQGWHVPLGYVAGFAALMLLVGWHPQGEVLTDAAAYPAVAQVPHTVQLDELDPPAAGREIVP